MLLLVTGELKVMHYAWGCARKYKSNQEFQEH